MLFGSGAFDVVASSLVMIRSPSGTRPGRLRTRLPVARITSVASSTRVLALPFSSVVSTWTFLPPCRRPRPWIHSTLFFLTSDIRPFVRRSTTAPRCCTTVGHSRLWSAIVTPMLFAFLTRS
jgi:hypothetical protein